MEIKALRLGEIAVNCYLLSTNKAAVIIDPGFASSEINAFIEENSDKETLILLTHGHFDHIGAVKELKEKYNLKVAIGELDAPALVDNNLNLSNLFGTDYNGTTADILVSDGDEITVGDITFKAIHTPGHTVGGMCYLLGDILFAGDTLFKYSIGRTDFPGGDYRTLMNSIKGLLTLSDQTSVLSGHGDETHIGMEKRYNPFLSERE